MKFKYICNLCPSCRKKYTEDKIKETIEFSPLYCYHTWLNEINKNRKNIYEMYERLDEDPV